jgi:cell division transport system ATP-binding protein
MTVAPLIDIQHLTWQYPREDQLIFDNFSLKLHQGEFCFLTGKSGAGKTTLVKFLLRQLTPPTKMIFFNKEDIARFSRTEVQAYRSRIGVVFQDFKLIDWMTVGENIMFPLTIHGQRKEEYQAHIDHLMHLLGLGHREQAYPAQLSG